jgi:hypothetical protein
MRKKQYRWVDIPDPKPPEVKKLESNPNPTDVKVPYFTDEKFYTGEKNKKLLVHILQNGIEVSKPIRKRIYDQQVLWKKRIYPIDPKRTIVDSKGIHHMYVSSNDSAVLSFSKDHEDLCRKCGGKMFIDARNARDLVKRNTIQAIWGIDSTHMILLLVFAIAAMAMAGFAFYSYNQDTLHNTQLKAEQQKNMALEHDYQLLLNQTRALLINNPDNSNPNNPIPPPNLTPQGNGFIIPPSNPVPSEQIPSEQTEQTKQDYPEPPEGRPNNNADDSLPDEKMVIQKYDNTRTITQ